MSNEVVVIKRADLGQGLKDILPVVSKTARVDALKNVHLTVEAGRLAVRGTNLSTSLKTWVAVEQAPGRAGNLRPGPAVSGVGGVAAGGEPDPGD